MVSCELNKSNFLLYSAKYYKNKNCENIEEFFNDLTIVLRLKKLLTRYSVAKTINFRLCINYVVSMFNVFDTEATITMMFFKIDKKYYSLVKTILVYLDRCPELVCFDNKVLNIKDIQIDEEFLNCLQNC